ncbi:MAG: preprotein translocase subunit YajC [Rhodospirillales bacterium]|nr:preprotein translocase subunit YajC [Rhodospirillales bacterium]MCW8861527.1 preprotein translocase subunit YajC [Rhodospirillales bacterium]MCW8952900.1 preprotein translocase subunit YajC [Rhodospirillales bacterium]MCW8971375.1 preprotein translocase subunit YajC [Rhodospirillales bacterium]MCW9001664.1 preprotein translocase subunit YajC [Rhodospirillales bacterium]
MFISPAFAQAAPGGDAASGIASLLPLVLIFVVFYFLLIRPQQKKMKEHKAMLSAVRRGDKIVTGGGIIGTVTKVINDDEVQVEISEGIKVRVRRSMIAENLAKTEPVSGGGDSDSKEKADADDKGNAETPAAASTPAGKLKSLLGGGKK